MATRDDETPVGEALVRNWLTGRSLPTRAVYERALADLRAMLGAASVDAVVADLLSDRGRGHAVAIAYRGELVERGAAPATVNVRISAVRSLVTHACKLGVVDWRLDVEGVRSRAYRDTRGPGRAGFVALLRAVAGEHACAQRDRLILWLMFGLGLRRAEVVSLDVEHVDLAAGRLAVLGKGQREREAISMPPPIAASVVALLEARGHEPGPLFRSMPRDVRRGGRRLTGRDVHRLVARLGRRAGVANARPHGLRHAGITAALDLGIDLRNVQVFSRHADPRTLIRYDDNRRDLGGQVAGLLGAAIAQDLAALSPEADGGAQSEGVTALDCALDSSRLEHVKP